MIYNYELRDIIIKLLKTNTKIELGNVYYKTKRGISLLLILWIWMRMTI